MPSSTSSSEPLRQPSPARAGAAGVSRQLLLGALLVFVLTPALLEGGTRFGFLRISTIERRIASEHTAALGLRHDPVQRSVLLVGNSLLLDDVDLEQLRRLLPKQLRVSRFAIEATWFLDWQYGLRRLFSDGARPDVVVLMLDSTNVVATAIRGDYSAYYLFNTADIPLLGRELGLTRTAQSSLLVARYSMFWAGRNNIRAFITRRVFADYAESLHNLAAPKPHLLSGPGAAQVSAQRLHEAAETVRSFGAQFVFIVPPGFNQAGERDLLQGARAAGVTTVVPVPGGTWPASRFRDGYHLSAEAAPLFTTQLAERLAPLLTERPASR
jgi:hypothetical protein